MSYKTANEETKEAREARSYALQRKVRQLMRENEGMSYDDAWRTANALPEMAPIVDAMEKPAQTSNASLFTQANFSKPDKTYAEGQGVQVPDTREGRDVVIQSAVAQLMASGKSYNEAFTLVRNHPDTKPIFDAMENRAATPPKGEVLKVITHAS